ncbi:MAG TPA: hypothetical protein P5125_02995 [Kiritimatiellia bacterium]|jgi:hypothetical protein|nr:hypothetical protein [Kiritimatiellia bacterium]HOR97533.1 hypothetical protein [Kiritimatiellia bacterium]HPK37158.1 hypothetical protein [Kiritimatiellia bacterium]HPW74874.1 hypothetical protein [Kiritimatiellia bacterium]HRU19299.1 hypothetical protein [Kiritimatiellia bacterium]
MQTNPWIIGLKAARANLVPGLILQAAAFALLASYTFLPPVRHALTEVGRWQARFGVPFSLASYLFFCGVVPYLFCLACPALRPAQRGRALAFALGFWGLMGLLIPQFYRLQSALYGNGTDVQTLVCKILTDQFVFSAFLTVPLVSLAHFWKDCGYRWEAVAPHMGRGWYSRLVLPNLVMNWTVWIPSLCVIYSLPTALQPHVAGLIGGFWALMCLQIAAHTPKTTRQPDCG